MSTTIELTREEYDKMVEEIASLKRACRTVKKQRQLLEDVTKKRKEALQKAEAEVGRLKFLLGLAELSKQKMEKQIEALAKSISAGITRVRVSRKGKKPVVVVFWEDGTKNCVKCNPEDTFSVNCGVALCICKRFLMPEAYRKYIVNCDYQVEEDDKPRKRLDELEERKTKSKAQEKLEEAYRTENVALKQEALQELAQENAKETGKAVKKPVSKKPAKKK